MGLDDAIDRLRQRLAQNATARSQHEAQRVQDNRDRQHAERNFVSAVSTNIAPAFKRVTDQLNDGVSVDSGYRVITLSVRDDNHGTHSLKYMLLDDDRVAIFRVLSAPGGRVDHGTTDGDPENVPISDLTQGRAEADVEGFLNWYLSRVS